MRTIWWIATLFVLMGAFAASALFYRRGSVRGMQAVAIIVVVYAFILAALWGMESHFVRLPTVQIPRAAKRIIRTQRLVIVSRIGDAQHRR